jgi:hypothetical protein
MKLLLQKNFDKSGNFCWSKTIKYYTGGPDITCQENLVIGDDKSLRFRNKNNWKFGQNLLDAKELIGFKNVILVAWLQFL